jgi:hypothetical protein
MEGPMGTKTVQRKTRRNFIDIPTAAFEAGYSARHFRRIIEEDRIPVLQIGRKFFIVWRDFEAWKVTKGEARFQQTIQQLDRWIKESAKVSAPLVDDSQDKDTEDTNELS